MKRLRALMFTLALAAFAPRDGSAYPENYGPFGEDEKPLVVGLRRCRVVDRQDSDGDHGFPIRVLSRDDDAPANAQLRVIPSRDRGGVFLEVIGSDGDVIAGPRQISDWISVRRAFWADLNGDGKEDFVQIVWSAGCGLAGEVCDVGFTLSSERGYSITSVRTMAPGPDDFIDLGDGECRFVHTAFVNGSREPGRDGRPHNYWVHNLLEFDGDRVVVSKADPRFPKWVWYTYKPNHRETTIITDEHKRRLWARVPDRIFRRPRGAKKTKEADEQQQPARRRSGAQG